MPPTVIDGTLRIRIIWALPGGVHAQNVLHSHIGSSATVDQDMADSIASKVASAHSDSDLDDYQPDSVEIERVEIRDLREANMALIESDEDLPSAGTIEDGDALPKQNALVVTHRTAKAGRSYRGRSYIPGLEEDASGDDGDASSGARDAAVDFLKELKSSMDSDDWPLAVASIEEEKATDITKFTSRNASFGVQRRRRSK